jgi:hypothetical protein
MRKLDDIPKQTPFKVPDGYFDELPNVIQSRMTKNTRIPTSRVVSLSLKFALPVVAIIVAGILWFRPAPSFESQFEDIDTDQIALYLSDADHPDPDEVNETVDFTTEELDQLEETIYSNIDL